MEVDRPLARDIVGNLDVAHTAMLEIRGNNVIGVDIAETRSVSLLIYFRKCCTVLHVVGHRPRLEGRSSGGHRPP
jgi:hypothetical protein